MSADTSEVNELLDQVLEDERQAALQEFREHHELTESIGHEAYS